MRVVVGSDHAGFLLKSGIKEYLCSLNYEVVDVGTDVKQSCHYPDYALKLSKVLQGDDRGILVCGSGIGICISANKCGVPCGTAYNQYTAKECRAVCKVMAIGERVVSLEVAKGMIKAFLQ